MGYFAKLSIGSDQIQPDLLYWVRFRIIGLDSIRPFALLGRIRSGSLGTRVSNPSILRCGDGVQSEHASAEMATTCAGDDASARK